jgi:hypothetical protein
MEAWRWDLTLTLSGPPRTTFVTGSLYLEASLNTESAAAIV